ncbi:MAG: radical SAM protein [Desulfobacteraceae bacterium]|nr:radical SAM protein [Desulfobacteraceae bacterium]
MAIIVLEHPRIRSEKRFNDIANTPLWSCLMGGYAAASMEQAGHEVCLLDATKKGWDFDRTEQEILSLSPAMLCVNAVYFWEHTTRLFCFLSRLRSAGFEGHINLFGFFPTLGYNVIIKEVTAVDSIVVGECEDTLAELAARLCKGEDWGNIPGLAYRASGWVRMAGPRIPEPNPDRFPFPIRDLGPQDTASILASRGCYNHCSFCPVPAFYNDGPLWRGRTPHNVLQEMTQLMDQGIRDFYFVDPNFIGPGKKGRRRILELVVLIRPLGIAFGMETRSNDLDGEILESLVLAGLQSLLLGIESGSASVIGCLHKGSSLKASERAISLCRSVGIEPEVGFLMFVPDSTVEDLKHNLEFLQRNNLLDRLDRTANLLCHCQIVLMGTSGYSHFKEQGRPAETGPLGFEGEISYLNERVRWMSELMVHACLYVLRDMSRPESPVYWCKSVDGRGFKGVNDYLVNLFKWLLKDVQKSTDLPPVRALKNDIERDLREKIARVGTETNMETSRAVPGHGSRPNGCS